jgi:hypothetical protein
MGIDKYPNTDTTSTKDDENTVVWSSEKVDEGLEAELNFEKTVRDVLQVTEIPEETDVEETCKDIVFKKATEKENTEKGFDFSFRDPRTGEWIPVDITTAKDHHVLNKKMEKERRVGVKILEFPGKVLERASMGCEKDYLEVYHKILKVVFDS